MGYKEVVVWDIRYVLECVCVYIMRYLFMELERVGARARGVGAARERGDERCDDDDEGGRDSGRGEGRRRGGKMMDSCSYSFVRGRGCVGGGRRGWMNACARA